jgi:hypothetical protein
MKRTLLVALLCCLALGVATSSEAVVVHFDDLVGEAAVPDGYGGITWDENWFYYGYEQPPYTPASPPNRVYQSYAKWGCCDVNAIPFYFSVPVLFGGAFFSGGGENPIYFELYLGSTLVATSGSLFPSATPTFLASGYAGAVDEVRVVSDAFRVMDDVTYEAVPEPGTLLLLGSALLGLPAARARRRRS